MRPGEKGFLISPLWSLSAVVPKLCCGFRSPTQLAKCPVRRPRGTLFPCFWRWDPGIRVIYNSGLMPTCSQVWELVWSSACTPSICCSWDMPVLRLAWDSLSQTPWEGPALPAEGSEAHSLLITGQSPSVVSVNPRASCRWVG